MIKGYDATSGNTPEEKLLDLAEMFSQRHVSDGDSVKKRAQVGMELAIFSYDFVTGNIDFDDKFCDQMFQYLGSDCFNFTTFLASPDMFWLKELSEEYVKKCLTLTE